MGQKSTIDKLDSAKKAKIYQCIQANRHLNLDDLIDLIQDLKIVDLSRSALGRYLQKLDARASLCAEPNQATIVTIVERGSGEVRIVKTWASGSLIASLIDNISNAPIIS